MSRLHRWRQGLGRWLVLIAVAGLLFEILVVARVALTRWIDPQSTTYQRSQMWQLALAKPPFEWHHQWVPLSRIHPHLQRAVIASEDDAFIDHNGVRWDSIEQAWRKNERAQSRASNPLKAKIVGGSTLTQQLAKNLWLSGERNLARKAQELVIAYALETFVSKPRILELYLNSVEWGRGTFGAESAALRHFGVSAQHLDRVQAARLAVLLPRPRVYEKNLEGSYLNDRAFTILSRMSQARLPQP
jgi:monofunctional biosynthetic peptidoglycan transglycosylase